MKILKICFSLFFSLLFLQAIGQKAKLESADLNYGNYAYVDAIDNYQKVAAKGYLNENMFQKLGNAYYFTSDYPQALKWYEQLFAQYPQQDAEYYYRYAQTLRSSGNYSKADEFVKQFYQKSNEDKRGLLFKGNPDYLEQIKANSGRFQVVDAAINTGFSDFGSTVFGNKLVFASARDTGGVSKKVFKWTNKSFSNLYWSEIKADGEMGSVQAFDKKINSKFNESTPVFTKNGKTMYFTRNNFLGGKRGRDTQKNTLLKLYKASLNEDGKWDMVTELPFNSNQYSVAHPALSPDEQSLYFASDMPGTLGQSDLFVVKINADGSFGVPQNLGPEVNTEGKETFPFISDDNELYFASDGRPGLGGLDIFVAKRQDDGNFYAIQNVGEPINSKQDDFGFIINSKNRNGFFSSSREGGKGSDDIYRFVENQRLLCQQQLSGYVSDDDSGAPIGSARLRLFDAEFKPLGEVLTDEQGHYRFSLSCANGYYLRAEKEDYLTKEIYVKGRALATANKEADLKLERRIKAVGVGTDLAKTLKIPVIYFDLDKSDIRSDAAFELAKVLAVLQQFPNMAVQVRSHTDSRQTSKYNKKLSDKRAKSTVAWLVNNGIAANRISGVGLGEEQLVNNCGDGISCTEEEHQANRRSEFIIISMY